MGSIEQSPPPPRNDQLSDLPPPQAKKVEGYENTTANASTQSIDS